jgi:asparagine synthase (glutamine-hydrolysing)
VPGLVGIVENQERSGAGPKSRLMLTAMERSGKHQTEAKIDRNGRWAIGRVHLGVLQPEAQLGGEDRVHVLFHGDLYDATESAALLRTSSASAPTSAAALIRALYRQYGLEVAPQLKGSFCAAILDEDEKRLLLINDRMGSYPLYWFATDTFFAFASELRPLVGIHPRPALNPRTVNDLIAFGFPMGDKTLATGIQLLDSESTLTFQWESGSVAINPYASWADSFRPTAMDKPEYLNALQDAFSVSMERSIAGSHRYGLSLSGGLDTRVLLSALDRMSITVSTFTLGGAGCADQVIGEQLATMARSRHRFVELEERYLADLLPMAGQMVSLTDGMYTSHGFTEMLALRAFEQSDFSVLLRGHAGELAKASTAWPLHTDAQIFEMTSKAQLIPYLLARLESLNHSSSAQGLFADGWTEASDAEGPGREIAESLHGVELSPPDLCSYLYLHEYHRRVTVPSLEIFRNAVEVRLPLADVDFVERVFQAPSRWRDGTEIHQALIRRNNPRYLRVRNPNTGAPAGAGPMQEFLLDKLNSVLRRLNVYGYRHYHAFDGWMRRAFLDVADQILLDARTVRRGIVKEMALRRLVTEARGGATQHDHVLQVLVLVELWQRENL